MFPFLTLQNDVKKRTQLPPPSSACPNPTPGRSKPSGHVVWSTPMLHPMDQRAPADQSAAPLPSPGPMLRRAACGTWRIFVRKAPEGTRLKSLGPAEIHDRSPIFFSWRIPSGYFNMRMEKHNFKWVNSRTRWATYIIARQQIAGSCIPFSDPKNNRVSSLGHAFQAVIQFPWSADDSCDWGGA